jgi:hypothetical protein
MYLQQSNLPQLARLFFKAHAELNDLLDAMHPTARVNYHPLLNLNMGPVRFEMAMAPESNSNIELCCAQGAQEYRVRLKSTDGTSLPTVSATLINKSTGESRQLDGVQVFSGAVPEDFKALHQEILAHLKAWLPEALWKRLTPSQTTTTANTSDASEPTTETTQGAVAAPDEASSGSVSAKEHEPPADDWRVYVLSQKDGPDLRFTGKLLDGVRTATHRGRWTEYHVYQTKGGRYVGVKLGRSQWLGEVDRTETKVVENLAELGDFFGHGHLAKLFTERLGIRQFVDVE